MATAKMPKKERVRVSTKYPKGVRWSGTARYKGRHFWVGSFATKEEWKDSRDDKIAEFKAQELAASEKPRRTVSDFANLHYDAEVGRVVPIDPKHKHWPYTHPRNVKKLSSFERYEEGIRRFIKEHGDRFMDSFDHAECARLAEKYGQHNREACRRFFGDARRWSVISGSNPWGELGYKKTKRKDRGDFELVSHEFVALLADCAVRSRQDDYGKVLRAMILLEACSAMRPAEIFGVEHRNVDVQAGMIWVEQQIDSKGRITPVKNELKRWAPMTPEALGAYLAAPRLSNRWAYPAPRGGMLKASLWDRYWNPVRALAGRPDFEFYELKHRACTDLVTPIESGGLGMTPLDAATVAGHQDGGETILRYYVDRDDRDAAELAVAAMRKRANQRPQLHAVADA